MSGFYLLPIVHKIFQMLLGNPTEQMAAQQLESDPGTQAKTKNHLLPTGGSPGPQAPQRSRLGLMPALEAEAGG